MLRLYNTLTRKKEKFRRWRKKVNLYTCGPTVYNYAHIGNLRTYIFADILERTLRFNGYRVKRVMNITDVGHLTGDSDIGEDKIDQAARAQNKSPMEIASFYTTAFFNDLEKLNVRKPEIIAPATQHIKEQQEIISQLFKKGYAYDTNTAVYFDVSKFKRYGKLSGQSLSEKLTAAREDVVRDPEKRNTADFALWFKRVGKFENHILHWSSPWGDGFPGWHIECSAISRTFLGQPIDIHTGGIDHIGTHHENEIAQSEAAYGTPLAKIWMHGEFLIIDKKRMGKSEGNLLTLQELKDRNINPLAYRYLVLSAHYRSPLTFSWESLESAQSGLQNIYNDIHRIWSDKESVSFEKVAYSRTGKRLLKNFTRALCDDLNTPKALAEFHSVLISSLSNIEKAKLITQFDEVLSLLNPSQLSQEAVDVPQKVRALVQEREKFRKNEQFMQSDALRKEIDELGYTVEDTGSGPRVFPKPHRHKL